MENKDGLEDRVQKIVNKIEEQVKSSKDEKPNNIVKKEKDDLLNKLFDMFPHLENEKNQLISEVYSKNVHSKKNIKRTNLEEVVLDQIKIDNEIYYKDSRGVIYDPKYNVVGTIVKSLNDNCIEKPILFDKINKDVPDRCCKYI